MRPEYSRWIDRHYPDWWSARGWCAKATAEMCTAFPELKRIRGWWNGIEHWWCVTPAGAIVDPTLRQFYPRIDGSPTDIAALTSPVEYHAFREGIDREPIGRCLCCGGWCWDDAPSAYACSPGCATELEEEYRVP